MSPFICQTRKSSAVSILGWNVLTLLVYNPYSLKDKNLKSQLIFLIARECLGKISKPLVFSFVFWEVGGKAAFYAFMWEASWNLTFVFRFFFSYRMIISETGTPTSLLTKVKDALFLAVYSMGNAVSFFLPWMPIYSSLKGQLAVLFYWLLWTELTGVIEIIFIKLVICLRLPKTD